jgi:glutaminase
MDTTTEGRYVSTGHLPSPRQVQDAVDEAYRTYRPEDSGQVSQTYPALARVPGHLFGICVAGTSGRIYRTGDAGHEFAVMSVAKPFVFALVCEQFGAERVRQKLGVNATGLPFDSLASVERSADGTSNPMVNAGAIAATSLVPGDGREARWRFLSDGLSGFAGRALALSDEVYASASATNHRNRAIANLLASRGRIYCDPAEAVDLYTRQSCLLTTAEDLAVMSATLADGGVNPVTGRRVITPGVCQHTLAVMATAGMYETSGDWLFDVGVPGKSGIGGGIIAVSPGKGGLGTFSPLLDGAGNSVRGQLAARHLSRTLGLSLFASEEDRHSPPAAAAPRDASRRLPAVALGLPAGARGQGAGPLLLGPGRAQGPVTGGLAGDRGALSPGGRRRRLPRGPAAWPCGPGRREPLGAQLGRRLPGQGRDPAAHPGQGLLERLGLHAGPLVLRPGRAARAVFGHPGTGRPAVLADVLVARAPDPGFQVDRRVLVQLGELGPLGLAHQQPFGVVEDRQQRRVHGRIRVLSRSIVISFTGFMSLA